MASSLLFTGKNGWLFSIAAHLSAKMRLNPIAVVITDGLKITVPPPDPSGRAFIKYLNAEMVLLISLLMVAVLGCK